MRKSYEIVSNAFFASRSFCRDSIQQHQEPPVKVESAGAEILHSGTRIFPSRRFPCGPSCTIKNMERSAHFPRPSDNPSTLELAQWSVRSQPVALSPSSIPIRNGSVCALLAQSGPVGRIHLLPRSSLAARTQEDRRNRSARSRPWRLVTLLSRWPTYDHNHCELSVRIPARGPHRTPQR